MFATLIRRRLPGSFPVLLVLALAGCGSNADSTPPSERFAPQTAGDPRSLWTHIVQLSDRYENTPMLNLAMVYEVVPAYADGVGQTAQAILKSDEATPEIRRRATEAWMATLHKLIEVDPEKGVEDLNAAVNEIESSSKGSEVAAIAAYHRLIALQEVPVSQLGGEEKRDQEVTEAALHLANMEPPFPETPMVLSNLARSDEREGKDQPARQIYAALAEKFPDSHEGHFASGAIQRLDQKGKVVEDFQGVGAGGKPVNLADYRGKVVLIDFWASWCQPCMDQMPKVKLLRDALQDKNFEVLGVNLDDKAGQVEGMLGEDRMSWPQILDRETHPDSDESQLALRFGVAEIPFMLLIDREGRLVTSANSIEAIQEPLHRLIPPDFEMPKRR